MYIFAYKHMSKLAICMYAYEQSKTSKTQKTHKQPTAKIFEQTIYDSDQHPMYLVIMFANKQITKLKDTKSQ